MKSHCCKFKYEEKAKEPKVSRCQNPRGGKWPEPKIPAPHYHNCITVCKTGGQIGKRLSAELLEKLEEDRKLALELNLAKLGEDRRNAQNVKFKMSQYARQAWISLEERRDRLQNLLSDEEDQFQCELEQLCGNNNQGSRIDVLRRRVGALKQERAAREEVFVREKLEQAFESQCEPLRALVTKRLEKDLEKDWQEQIAEKQRLKWEADEEEKMWTQLWLADAEQKQKLDEAYIQMRAELNRHGVEQLRQQIEEKREFKQNYTDKMKALELAQVENEREEIEQEKRLAEMTKKDKFTQSREQLDETLRTRNLYRDRRLKKEEIVAKEFLKRAIRELHMEKLDKSKKKKETTEAIRAHLEYLEKRGCLMRKKEDTIQAMIDELIEEQHQKVMESRRREHQQRKELSQLVMAGRAQQLQDLKEKKELEEREEAEELETLMKDLKLVLMQEFVYGTAASLRKEQYIADLIAQKDYNQTIKEREKAEELRNHDLCQIGEVLFQNRLKKALEDAKITNPNPHRAGLVGKSTQQFKTCLNTNF